MKLSLNLSDELVCEIDKKADSLFLNRTACITMLLAQALQQDKMISSLDIISKGISEHEGVASGKG